MALIVAPFESNYHVCTIKTTNIENHFDDTYKRVKTLSRRSTVSIAVYAYATNDYANAFLHHRIRHNHRSGRVTDSYSGWTVPRLPPMWIGT